MDIASAVPSGAPIRNDPITGHSLTLLSEHLALAVKNFSITESLVLHPGDGFPVIFHLREWSYAPSVDGRRSTADVE